MLHPIDLAINKVLTLAGRNEVRDFIDTMYMHQKTLSLGALIWAAVAKDPGFNPQSLLELLRRRGKIRPEDLLRLHLKEKIDLESIKQQWLLALSDAEKFVKERPPEEVGCLYYSKSKQTFFTPKINDKKGKDYELHFGRPGGVLPLIQN
jgi:hypothetical protein